MDGLIKIFNDIQTKEWTDYEILKDFTENEQTRFCYDWDGFDSERVLPAITNILKENQQLKENYDRIYNENCKLREEYNITDIGLLDENYKLKKQKDDVVEYIKNETEESENKIDDYAISKYVKRDILRMLGEIDE